MRLPPDAMPARDGLRPLKAWRYVAAFAPEFMLCACRARIGPARQSFWALWDRRRGELHEHTSRGDGGVELSPGRLVVRSEAVDIDLELDEQAGIETICSSGRSFGWTRKQGDVEMRGRIHLGGAAIEVDARGVIDDTAAYYERHTRWWWSAGVGLSADGRRVAWNLVKGVNDPPQNSERTVWVDAVPHEPPPSRFAPDLGAVDGLTFTSEAVREQRQNLLAVRSSYRQPFGTFAGGVHPGIEVAQGFGVMEYHDVWW